MMAPTTVGAERMLIESAVPTFEAMIADHALVDADPPTTFRAARGLDLLTVRTPLLSASMWIRGLPARLVGKAAPPPLRLVIAEGVGFQAGYCWASNRTARSPRRGGTLLAAGHRMARCANEFQCLFRTGWGKDRG